MFKRVTIVALVVAAFVLLMAVPALAFNGYRGDYTTSKYCSICHQKGQPGTAPKVYDQWALTKHGTDSEAASALRSLPYGSVCAGCHTANYDPRKVTPSPSGTTYVADPSTITGTQQSGTSAASELDIGCSSCHYGSTTGSDPSYGSDPNDTAHMAPYGLLADAQICGACHSRFSYTTQVIPVTPVPGAATPTPSIQPQMAIGYPMLGAPSATGWNPASLASYLNVSSPGWNPTPTATSAGFAKLQTYWRTNAAGPDTKWQQSGHDGSAAQYPEWASEGHAAALTALTSEPFWASLPEASKQECLQCHSADFRLLKDAGRNPTSTDAKYGITCVGCHTPHDAGTIKGVWDEEMDAQLVDNANLGGNGSNLCTECHTDQLTANTAASPGAEVHNAQKEIMDGYGAIDVASFPSVHKGKCIQCHMAPTSYSRGSAQMGGNHTFEIIDPATADETIPVPIATQTTLATQFPLPGATATPIVTNVSKTVTEVDARMPYSACSTCHDNNQQPQTVISGTSATTKATASATPQAGYDVVTTTVTNQAMAATGDKGLWLQDTLDQRQAWTTAKITEIQNYLNAAAVRLGYADSSAAQAALVAKAESDRTTAETGLLKAWTNVQFVSSEGSLGIHNWDYTRQIVNTAIWEAQSVSAQPAPAPWSVAFKASKTKVKKNTKVKFSGTIAPAEAMAFGHATVTLQKYSKSKWSKWKTVTCNAAGAYNISVKMTSKGTFKFRALMPAYTTKNMTEGISKTIKVKVTK